MSKFGAILRRWKAIAFASAIAGLSYWFAPSDIIATISGELVNFFGFVIAAVLPAMALTATALRGSGMSIRRLIQLRNALDEQMSFWAGLVFVSFAAVAFVVILKPIVSCGSATECKPIVFYEYGWMNLNSRIFNAVLAYIFGIVVFQLGNVLRGLRALLTVNAEAAIGEAQQRYDDQMANTEAGIRQVENPPGHGAFVELPRDPRA
ncbi:hypothetical protein R1A27_08535 [Methylobacterium sp. NMS12]|uniref:hypothetical protein n=1 Tax=Methylobacterium sp. NMS12 TaxID=3079766 RepID=UPI003F882990